MAGVEADIQGRIALGPVDWVFAMRSRGRKLGQLQMSAGTIDWWPAKSRDTRTTLTWRRLAEVMEGAESNARPRTRGRATRRPR